MEIERAIDLTLQGRLAEALYIELEVPRPKISELFSGAPRVGKFKVGQNVRVKIGDKWELGTVVHPKGVPNPGYGYSEPRNRITKIFPAQYDDFGSLVVPVYLHRSGTSSWSREDDLQPHGRMESRGVSEEDELEFEPDNDLSDELKSRGWSDNGKYFTHPKYLRHSIQASGSDWIHHYWLAPDGTGSREGQGEGRGSLARYLQQFR